MQSCCRFIFSLVSDIKLSRRLVHEICGLQIKFIRIFKPNLWKYVDETKLNLLRIFSCVYYLLLNIMPTW
jgi:hypothetical protein